MNALVHCELLAQPIWVQIFTTMHFLFRIIIFTYGPAVPLLLPDWIFNIQLEYEEEKRNDKRLRNNQVSPVQQNDNAHTEVELSTSAEFPSSERNSYSGRGSSLQREHERENGEELQVSPNQQNDNEQTEVEAITSTELSSSKENSYSGRGSSLQTEHARENNEELRVSPDQQNDNKQTEVEAITSTELSSSKENSYSGRGSSLQTEHERENNEELRVSPDQQKEAKQRERRDEEDSDQEGDKSPDEGMLNREIPLDDESPITICALLSDYVGELPAFKVNFNLKLLFLCFVVLPFPLYLEFALIMCYKMELYHEFYLKDSNFPYCKQKADMAEVFVCNIAGLSFDHLWTISSTFILIGCVTLFLIVLCIRPMALLYPKQVGHICLISDCKPSSLGNEILKHLNLLHHLAYDVMFYALWKYVNSLNVLHKCLVKCVVRTRIRSTVVPLWLLCSLCFLFPYFVVGLFVGTLLGAIFVVFFLMALGLLFVSLSPGVLLLHLFLHKVVELDFHIRACFELNGGCLLWFITFLYVIPLSSAHSLVALVLLGTGTFIVKLFLLTVMGLTLNVDLVTPYVAFILVVTKNLHLCYCNLQSKYTEVKGMISEQWKKSTERLPWVDNTNYETIPEELFWFVCGKGRLAHQQNVIPLRAELCRMLRDMVVIVVFLFVSLFAILIFKSMNDLSVLVSTIFVFVSGVIPSLIFGGFTKKEKFSGWERINMKKKIKEAVKEYVRRMKEGDDDGGYEIESVSDDDSDDPEGCCERFLDVL